MSTDISPPVFPSLEREVTCPYVQSFVRQCRRTWSQARTTLLKARGRYTYYANRRSFKEPSYTVGQRVRLFTKNLLLQSDSKLSPKFIGPFPIERIINPAAVQLRLPRSMRVHPTSHVSQIKPVLGRPLSTVTPQLPPPRLIDGGLTFTVRCIIHSR